MDALSRADRPQSATSGNLISNVISGEAEMDCLDATYQNTVDLEVDRLARLSPCELMRIQPKSWQVNTGHGVVELTYLIFDSSDHRHIAVMAERPVLLGFARRKFAGALKVQLSSERLCSYEAAALYD